MMGRYRATEEPTPPFGHPSQEGMLGGGSLSIAKTRDCPYGNNLNTPALGAETAPLQDQFKTQNSCHPHTPTPPLPHSPSPLRNDLIHPPRNLINLQGLNRRR